MVTMGLIAMCGMMGLAVDLGWSYFVEKQPRLRRTRRRSRLCRKLARGFPAPSASRVRSRRRQSGLLPAGGCDLHGGRWDYTSNLWNGCLYGQSNGFTDGGLSGRQKVTIQANDSSTLPPTAPGVSGMPTG